VKKTIFKLFRNKNKVLTFGGGHDYAYGDIAGFLDCTLKLKKRPVVINVDAHLDMRRPVHGLSSGTPFYRLLSEYKGFDLLTVGTHEHCNAKAHYAYAKDKKVKVINFPDINKFLALCKKLKASQRPIFLSIDMDAFSSYYAPGVSAAWPIGISPEAFSKFFKILLKGQVCGVGIYEVSPPLDENRKTTRLAALIAYEYLKSL
jgi:formiminoglutamase